MTVIVIARVIVTVRVAMNDSNIKCNSDNEDHSDSNTSSNSKSNIARATVTVRVTTKETVTATVRLIVTISEEQTEGVKKKLKKMRFEIFVPNTKQGGYHLPFDKGRFEISSNRRSTKDWCSSDA